MPREWVRLGEGGLRDGTVPEGFPGAEAWGVEKRLISLSGEKKPPLSLPLASPRASLRLPSPQTRGWLATSYTPSHLGCARGGQLAPNKRATRAAGAGEGKGHLGAWRWGDRATPRLAVAAAGSSGGARSALQSVDKVER